MKLKVGDKLLCKKTYNFNCYNIVEGKYYEISKIFHNIYLQLYYYLDPNNYFNLNKDSSYYIWNFFYTPQEMRKMKLERLKQC